MVLSSLFVLSMCAAAATSGLFSDIEPGTAELRTADYVSELNENDASFEEWSNGCGCEWVPGEVEADTVAGPSAALSSTVVQSDPFEGDQFVENKTFLTTYYLHLRSNMPRNRLGICGYTGIAMFLSFYDTYWNDDFISDEYDSDVITMKGSVLYSSSASAYQSPGVYNNITSSDPSIEDLKEEIYEEGITDESSVEFKEALDKKIMAEVYAQIDAGTFLGKLFEIAIANGSIQPHFDESEYHSTEEGSYVSGIGVGNTIMTNVLSDYIEGNKNLKNKVEIVASKADDSISGESERIRSEIVDIVKTGRPVLMGGNGYTDSNGNGKQDDGESSFGHVVVAYDYDEENDVLYGNMGWSSSTTSHYNLDDYFNIKYSDYWALNIRSVDRGRTDHYIFTDQCARYSASTNELYNVISPADYGFPQSYGEPDVPIEQDVILPDTAEIFSTYRQRCGYIEQQCINISPRRYEPGIGFLQYTFDRSISSIDVQLSWWFENETVTPENSEYRVEYVDSSGSFVEILDLWDEELSLSITRWAPSKVHLDFPEGVKSFRFYGQVDDPVFSRNKGRLSILVMTLVYGEWN